MSMSNETTHPGEYQLDEQERAVVQAIREKGNLSRTGLSKELSYSRSSLTAIVNKLLQVGLLSEVGEGQSGGGRRPTLLDINPDYGYVAGIDIGATSVDIALADFNGRIIEEYASHADVRTEPELFLADLSMMLLEMLDACKISPNSLLSIGVGVPGPVQFSTGMLVAPPLMPAWENFPIKTAFRGTFPAAQVFVDNDVNIMAIGESIAGGGSALDNFLFVKVGTGIGCGIYLNGQIYRGSDGCAGDIGHICIDYNGPICHCGNPGCLEIMAAGPAIAELGRQAALAGKSQFLSERLEAQQGQLTTKDVADAAAAGDAAANEIIKQSGTMLGGALASLVNAFNPQAIFIGGGVTNIGLTYLATIRQATLRRATALSTRKLGIQYSQLADKVGITGAIWLALENIFA